MVKTKKIGIIGYNDGNGHPFSYSAIINGYNQASMDASPYPNIAKYLSKRLPSEFGIDNWRISHIWCPDIDMTHLIANCTNIEFRLDDYQAMATEVDAVIIARDDAESHLPIAQFFLERNLPVFVDKPLCDNLQELVYFKPFLESGLLMSCSGLRYHPLILTSCNGLLDPADIVYSYNVSIIDWFKYGIHVLEGMIAVMGRDVLWVQNTGEKGNDIVRVQFSSGKFAIIQVNNQTGFILRSTFYTNTFNHFQIDYDDNFICFKNMLLRFADQLNTKIASIQSDETITIIKVLCAGNISLQQNGRKVYISEFDHV